MNFEGGAWTPSAFYDMDGVGNGQYGLGVDDMDRELGIYGVAEMDWDRGSRYEWVWQIWMGVGAAGWKIWHIFWNKGVDTNGGVSLEMGGTIPLQNMYIVLLYYFYFIREAS